MAYRMSSATPSIVPQMLAEYGDITRQAAREYLPAHEPKRYLYDLVADYPARGGKMMRSTLCIAATRAWGGQMKDAIPCAVSIELLHNALLIHDDIEDESDERRGKPTLHAEHGVPLAINAGDTLTLLSMRPLFENIETLGPRLSRKILRETDRMAAETAEGQALELGWRRDNIIELEDDDYLIMVLKKTCWLATIYPLRLGAMLAGVTDDDSALLRFGFFVGAAFQIQDDMLNLLGDQSYGKEIDGDLHEGKRTLMLLRLFRCANNAERARLLEIYRGERETRTELDVRWVRERMDHYDCLRYAREIAHGLAGAAMNEFERFGKDLPDSKDKRFIQGLVTWIFEQT